MSGAEQRRCCRLTMRTGCKRFSLRPCPSAGLQFALAARALLHHFYGICMYVQLGGPIAGQRGRNGRRLLQLARARREPHFVTGPKLPLVLTDVCLSCLFAGCGVGGDGRSALWPLALYPVHPRSSQRYGLLMRVCRAQRLTFAMCVRAGLHRFWWRGRYMLLLASYSPYMSWRKTQAKVLHDSLCRLAAINI
jgi:hypothetical protein